MTGNVWFVILPSQRELIAATTEGREQDPAIGYQAKQRSIHNNYFTFPLLFIMLSNHFPAATGHALNWLVLIAVIFGIQFYFDRAKEQQVYIKQMLPESEELQALRAREDSDLYSYRYIDRAKRQVRLPITRADIAAALAKEDENG